MPHSRGAKHPFLGRLNCADACLPPTGKLTGGDIQTVPQAGCKAPFLDRAAQFRIRSLAAGRGSIAQEICVFARR